MLVCREGGGGRVGEGREGFGEGEKREGEREVRGERKE